MNKLDEIINHLASQEPKLEDADLLCDQILDSLPSRPARIARKPMPYWNVVLRCITSAAAIFLLVFYVQTQRPAPLAEEPDYSVSLASMQPAWRASLSANAPAQQILQEYVQAKKYNQTIVELKKRLTR